MAKPIDEMQDILKRPFDRSSGEVKQRKGGRGKMLDYIATPTAIRRLDEATGGEWSFELEWPPLIVSTYQNEYTDNRTGEVKGGKGNPVETLLVGGHLTIPGLGRRGGMGVTNIVEGAGEDNLKGAASDCLKKAATLFGVALDLYEQPPTGNQPQPQGYQRPENGTERRAPSGNNEVTKKQRDLFESLVGELELSPGQVDAIAKKASGYGVQRLNKVGMSKTIDALQQEKRRRDDNSNDGAYYEDGVQPPAEYEHDVPQQQGRKSGTDVRQAKAKALATIAEAKDEAHLDRIFGRLDELGIGEDEDLLRAAKSRMEQLGL